MDITYIQINVWNAATGVEYERLQMHPNKVRDINFAQLQEKPFLNVLTENQLKVYEFR